MALPWDVYATPIGARKYGRLGMEQGEVVVRPAATQSWYWRAGASRSLRVTGRIAGVPRACPATTTVGPVIASKSSNRQRNA